MNQEPSSEHLRLFVAIVVPEPIQAELEEVQGKLQRVAPSPGIRWTKIHQTHLTLRFLGDVPASAMGKLTETLRPACTVFPPIVLSAENIGFFPNTRSPRVLWAGVADSDGSLSALQQRVQETTREFTTEPIEKAFVGHLTLARIKYIHRPEAEALAKAGVAFSGTCFGQWTAEQLVLFRSELSSAGATHRVCEAFGLAGKA